MTDHAPITRPICPSPITRASASAKPQVKRSRDRSRTDHGDHGATDHAIHPPLRGGIVIAPLPESATNTLKEDLMAARSAPEYETVTAACPCHGYTVAVLIEEEPPIDGRRVHALHCPVTRGGAA